MGLIRNHAIYLSCDLMRDIGPGTPFNADGSREYTYRYQVRAKLPITEIQACVCPGIPLPFANHPRDLAALVTRHRGEMVDREDPTLWLVEVTFSTRIPPGGAGAQTPDVYQDKPADSNLGALNRPELEPPDIEWEFDIIQKSVAKDLDGKTFLNTAGQPYTPAPTFEFACPVLSISRNEDDYNHKRAAKYALAVNKDKFLGYPPKCVQCMPPKAKLSYRGGIAYWRVSYRLRFGIMGDNGKPIPWDPFEILDAGLMELKKLPLLAKPVLVPIRLNGSVVTQPVMLDGKGKALPPFEFFAAGNVTLPATPRYNYFRMRPTVSFSDLIKNGLGGRL